MKYILTTILSLSTMLLMADIPRVDIMEVTYQGETYYKWEFVSHLKFEKGCVFNYSGEYLYEEEDYYKYRHNDDRLHFYRDMVSIPKSKVWSHYDSLNNYSSHDLIELVGDKIEISGTALDSIIITKIHLGNTAGYQYSPDLSKKDEDWIRDYELEKIVRFGDGELCDMELFSIKGNISKSEALGIKNEIRSLYIERRKSNKSDSKSPNEYLNELLKRNILMIGFCSC